MYAFTFLTMNSNFIKPQTANYLEVKTSLRMFKSRTIDRENKSYINIRYFFENTTICTEKHETLTDRHFQSGQ